jgi:CDP-diacylglycerol--serine O-phosphatidyltransferase
MAYVLFELPNSWLKRRMGIAPGASATRGAFVFTLLDKTDSALGVSLVFCVLRDFSRGDTTLFFITASGLHFLFSWILYLRKIKKAF